MTYFNLKPFGGDTEETHIKARDFLKQLVNCFDDRIDSILVGWKPKRKLKAL